MGCPEGSFNSRVQQASAGDVGVADAIVTTQAPCLDGLRPYGVGFISDVFVL